MQSNLSIFFRVSGTVLFTSMLLAGCSTDKKANAAQPAAAKEGSVSPRPAVITASTQPYRAVQVTGGAKLSGTVDFEGVLPRDSTITLPADQSGCGQTITVKSVENTGTKIGGAVVWITDIRSGKPLPMQKRFELVNEDCRLSPHVQAVVASGTLNVASEDVAMHRNRIINVGTGEVEGIAPFNDNGEVVPFDRLLDKPEQLEVICDLHPWSRAHILVVDHPYFATTERSGSFSIDDVPPGTYRVKAWHPSLGVAEQTVTVVAGQPVSIALKIAPAPVPAAAVDSQKGGA